MSAPALTPVQPGRKDVRTAVEALPHIKDYLTRHHQQQVRVMVTDEHDSESLTVPRSAVVLLARILAHMAAGQGVSIVPSNAELTTQQAADMLNVSRPFLIGLLDQNEIEFRKVGKHRRIKAESLLTYMRADDHIKQSAADELTQLNQDLGLI